MTIAEPAGCRYSGAFAQKVVLSARQPDYVNQPMLKWAGRTLGSIVKLRI